MARVNIDTDLMRECGSNIVNYANDYVNAINGLCNRLASVKNNHEWNGSSADAFIFNVLNDKKTFLAVGKQLKSFGNSLSNSAYKIDRAISKNNIG